MPRGCRLQSEETEVMAETGRPAVRVSPLPVDHRRGTHGPYPCNGGSSIGLRVRVMTSCSRSWVVGVESNTGVCSLVYSEAINRERNVAVGGGLLHAIL